MKLTAAKTVIRVANVSLGIGLDFPDDVMEGNLAEKYYEISKAEVSPDGVLHLEGTWPFAGRWSDYGMDYDGDEMEIAEKVEDGEKKKIQSIVQSSGYSIQDFHIEDNSFWLELTGPAWLQKAGEGVPEHEWFR